MIIILKSDKIEILTETEEEKVNDENVERHEIKIESDDLLLRDKR